MPSPPRQKLHSLTALRFIAAALIVLHHAASHRPFLQALTDNFHLPQAVSFFFVLSGFILAHVYPSLDTWPSRARFWRARVARIWPGHLAAFALLWLLLHTPSNFPVPAASLPVALFNLSLLHAWIPVRNIYYSFNPVAWTISTEFAFYLLFPLLIHNLRRTWWIKLSLSLALAIACVALVKHLHLQSDDYLHPWTLSATGLLYISPLTRLFEFTLGISTALLFQHVAPRLRLPTAPATLFEAAALALALLNMHLAPTLARLLVGHSHAAEPLRDVLTVGPLSCLSFAALIFTMALHAGLLSRALSSPPAVLLGEISYALYLLHYVLLTWFDQHTPLFASLPPFLTDILFTLTLLTLSYLVYQFLERPLRHLLTTFPARLNTGLRPR